MKKNLKTALLILGLSMFSLGFLSRTARAFSINTQNIFRQNPPNPPTPPTKPEPSPPPTPPCGDPGCPSPSPSPTPSEFPTPTPTPPPAEGGGTGGAPFQFGGPPPPPPAEPQVLGLSDTSSGNLEAALFILGAICIAGGLKVLSPKSSSS